MGKQGDGIMVDIIAISEAWKAGKIIKNPEKWKSGTELTNYLTAILAGIFAIVKWQYPDLIIPEEAKDIVLQILGGVLVLINIVSNRITTTKDIGIKILKSKKSD